ncbi:Sensor histidine kinase RcsC [subsurface metagenome]
MKKLKFLYLEKEVHEVDIISKKLKEEGIEFTLKHVNSMENFEQEINLCNYDIIFSCYSKQQCNCLNSLEIIKNICPNIPFIIISEDIGEDIAIEAYKLGATDFVNKNRLSGLVPSITRAMYEVRAREQRLQTEDMKNKYDFIINTSKSFFSLIDKNYTYKAINDAFCYAHNLLREKIIGKTLSEIWGEKSFREIIKPNIDKSFTNHEVKYQAWFETPKLGLRCYEVAFYPYTDQHSEVTHTVVNTIDITEKKNNEKALTESEEKYSNLVEMAQDGILIIVNGKFIYANPVMSQMTGYEKDEILGQPFQKFIHPSEVSKITKNYINIMAGKEVPNIYDSKIVKKDGTVADIEINTSIINYSGEKGLFIILRDITGRKKTEEQNRQHTEDITLINSLNTLANKGETFERIFRHFSDKIMRIYSSHLFAISILTQDKKELVVENLSMNHKLMKNLEKMVGVKVMKHHVKLPETGLIMNGIHSGKPMILESKSAINQFIRELSNKESSKKIASQISKFLEMNYIVAFPLVSERKVIGLVIVVRKNKFTGKDIQRLSNLFEQITSIIIRKRVEEEMEKLSTAIEQLAETVVITDTKGNIRYANPAFEKISGYLREDVLGENPRILQSGKHDKKFYKNMWDTISGGNVWSGTLINKRKDGRIFLEKANISPIKDETGKITNYVGVKRDITRESELEAQLIQSQRLETAGTLARGIAHDFNNILGTMQGYNDMAIEEAPENSKLYTYLKSIKIASIRAQDLVNQILTFSRDVKPERKSTSIQNLLNDSLEFLKPSISPGVKIVKRIKEECEPVSADPSQIQQVILNLLANANQAMRDTGGELTIEFQMVKFVKDGTKVHSELMEKNYVNLTIRDTGVGMDKKTVERIFEPFFTTKSVGEGTGLGLSVVYGIIKNHNGVITVESELGKGTAFDVYLPVTDLT